jgi:hypothetical protein
MASQLDDEVLAQFVPMAPYAEIAPMMKARYGGLGSRITFPMPADPAHDAQATVAIRALGGGS